MRRDDPFDEDPFEDVFRGIERMFDELREEMDRGSAVPAAAGPGERRDMAVAVDADEETVLVVADLPGIAAEEIDLQCDGWTVRIAAVAGRRRYDERVELPAKVDPESAAATFNNGVLEVRMDRTGSGTRIELS